VEAAKTRLELNPWYPEMAGQISSGPSQDIMEIDNKPTTKKRKTPLIDITKEIINTQPKLPNHDRPRASQRARSSAPTTLTKGPNETHQTQNKNSQCGTQNSTICDESDHDFDEDNFQECTQTMDSLEPLWKPGRTTNKRGESKENEKPSQW